MLHDLLTTIRPDVVITSDYPSLLSTPDHPVNASPAAMAEIGAGMAQYWTRLEDAGISVTPIKESPDLVEDVPTCVDQHPTDLALCDVPVSSGNPAGFARHRRGEADERQGHRGQRELADLRAAVCAPVVGNVLVFGDRHHLTWPYSKSTAPFLEPLLLQANKVLAAGPDDGDRPAGLTPARHRSSAAAAAGRVPRRALATGSGCGVTRRRAMRRPSISVTVIV